MSTYRDRPLPHSAPQLLEVRGEPTAFCSSSPSLHPPYHEHHAPLSIPNGHCPPPTQTMQLVAPPTQVPSRSSVPKMGIRARVADWPPRRDRSRESLLQNGHSGKAGGGVNQGAGPFRRSPALLPLPRRRREVGFGSRLGGSSPSLYRPPPPLQRSSSEVTLSEQDPAEQGAEPGEGPRLGAGLYREYGSTSSIDTAAIPEQSFSHLLSQFHRERSPAQDTPLRPTDQPRVRQKSGGGEGTTSSLLRKLRITTKGAEPDPEPDPEAEEGGGAWVCPRSFVHYDVQSLLFDPHAAAASQRSHSASQRKNTNTATGASAASTGHAPNHVEPQDTDTPPDGTDAAPVDNPDSYHDDRLLISCPHFHIEAPGRTERDVSFLGRRGGAVTTAATGLHHSNASVSVLEVPPELQLTRLERLQNHSIEHLDLGARYYRQHFHNTEHSNYFGSDEKLGPVALSIRREKLEDTAELKDQYQYRIILRTTELVTLRGTVLEDSVLSTSRHGLARGLPLKEVLEGVVPELGVACLRLALATPKVTEQLLKLDEQGLSQKRKVGVLLCRAGQSMEEEMYNNEEATPAFSHFLELLGERVCLRGFSKYAAQLDTKTDSTGTHSLYTTYQDYEVMFHVSTMLPYMPNNPQQLLRKRHIGNDIVTIIFQEPGALPFTPQSIRSHFQHVFIIVRVHNPCSDSTCYSVAVTSMEDVPPFGPPIPEGETFRDPEAFRDFLLAKVINGENAAHKSAKFHTMAMRTRREYLRDLAENCVSSTPLDSTGKLNNLISLASKRRERIRAREGAELGAMGTVAWRVLARDLGGGGGTGPELPCLLAISGEYMVLVDSATKEVVFNCFCADVIGWTAERLALKVYFGRGDHIAFSVPEGQATDVQDVLQRLKALTVGCNTAEMTLRRNGLGQLGFHVRGDGTVAEVEEYGFAWQAGLRPGSRLVEICKVAAVTLSHEHMIDLLRTSVTVKVLIIPPFPEGGARRGCTEEYDLKAGDHSPEAIAVGYHPPLRPQTWHRDGPPAPRHSPMVLPQPLPQSLPRSHKILVPAPYREPQHGLSKRPMSFPENHYSLATIGGDRVPSFRNPSGSFSSLGSGLAGPFVQYKPSPDRYSTPQRPPMGFEPHLSLDLTSSGESGFTSQESTMERCKTEPLWHIPASARMQAGGGGSGGGVQKRSRRQDVPGKDSPTCNSKGEAPYSSHSSSNTLSSNASSNHSDERWFEGAGPAMGAEPGSDALGKRGSSDSGIDAATLYSPGSHNALLSATLYNTPQELIRLGREPRRRGESRPSPAPGSAPSSSSSRQSKSYNTRTFPLPSTPSDAHKPSRSCYTPQGFQVSAVDRRQPVRAATVTPSSASRHSAQPPKTAPKPSYCRSAPRLPPPSASTTVPPTVACPGSTDSRSSSKQVEVSSKNVFGQPRLRASLRDLRSPRRAHKSTVEDDLKKLIIMDSTETPHRDTSPPRRTLQRTFSDESLSSSRRDSGPFDSSAPLTSDLLFTNTMPPRRATAHHDLATNRKVPVCVPEITPSEVRDRGPPLRNLDPGLMPLPDTDCGLEWSSLVNAARAYEVQRTVSLFSLSESRAGGPEINPAVTPVQTPRATPNLSSDEVAGDLPGRLHHLEVMLKQLNKDLEKEKQDKVALLAEVANLRENNQRLQEESQCASQQLRNLSQLLTSSTPDRK